MEPVNQDKKNTGATVQPPQAKRKKLSLAKTKSTGEHFSDTVSNEELEKMSCGFVPANTRLSGLLVNSSHGWSHEIVVLGKILTSIFSTSSFQVGKFPNRNSVVC